MIGAEYKGVSRINGPLVFVEKAKNVGLNEVVEIAGDDGLIRLGQVLMVNEDIALVQVFEGTGGLNISDTSVKFLGHPLFVQVSEDMLGRIFNGLGEPIDDAPRPFTRDMENINGMPINPYSRVYPKDFIQTGISAIDGMNTLVRGQKLPIFSGNGLPHNRIAAQIARQAKLLSTTEEFTIVFAAMGIKFDVAQFFIKSFEESGVLNKVVMFLSLADDPSIERLVTPRTALTVAEYLAYQKNHHVLVILTDMTNYCEALREISSSRGEIPSRKGYPGYLYSDLSSIYERAGKIKASTGSITQMPILTMPNDDISHPIPDLSGYITEGQIVLERELFQKSIYPPIAGLPSLSRLMKDGIGEGLTREDHPNIASQLFAAYSKVKDIRALASVIGEEELSTLDKTYLKFGVEFESKLLSQGEFENRSIEETLGIGWDIISILPKSELYRVKEEQIKKYFKGKEEEE